MSHPTSPIEHVPSELTAEFERRVQALMERWKRLYAMAGVPDIVSPDTDRHVAEWRVGREMGLL